MKVGIVGLGLIGGSLARALLDRCGLRVWDRSPGARDGASEAGISIATPEDLARWADLVIVAVPPEETAGVCKELLLKGAPAVLDTCSVKEEICREVGQRGFLGGHPLAGTAERGWRASRADIIEGCTWALVGESPEREVFLRAGRLLQLLGSPWAAVTPAEHDRALARSAHLVQMLHVVLAASASDWSPLARRLSGPALRDTTRLAESPFEMWQSIISANEDNIGAVLFSLAEELRSAQLAVLHPDADARTLWRHGSLGRQQILSARQTSWRETSVPEGVWWEELLRRSLKGALFQNPRFDTGLLLLEQA